MLAIHGGRLKNKRGGGSLASLSPGDFGGVGNLATPGVNPNYAQNPQTIPQNKMVGGSYGYASGSDAATFGGSYPPVQTACTNGNADPSRGGNNFMSGGSRRRRSKRSGKRSSTKRSSTKRSSKKGGHKCTKKHKHSIKKGGKIYKQRGCSKKWKGGVLLV
jgi:hypothetical protein